MLSNPKNACDLENFILLHCAGICPHPAVRGAGEDSFLIDFLDENKAQKQQILYLKMVY